ncbi:zinc finger, CCHC-type containing protein [Tanacetum coccineum]
MYVMTSTRPDIAYVVGRLSRFTSNPSRQHWQAITRMFKYLKDSSSTSGCVFLLGGGAISWASKKQTCITGSTMESEFVALAATGKEVEWLINLAYSQIYNGKSRHLGVRHSMVRELIKNGVISIEFVRTQHNLAEHLTKGLAKDLAMAEEDAFLVDNVEGGLCVDYTDAKIIGRCNSGSDKDKGKELWDSLESKYMEEDSSSKKFLDFKHTLKHGKDDLSLVQLGSHLHIEESLRAQDSDKGKGKEVAGPSVKLGEDGLVPTSRGIVIVVIRRTQMLVVREKGLRTIPKTKVDLVPVWNRFINLFSFTIFLKHFLLRVEIDAIEWWIDSGATTHVCKDRCRFKTYEQVKDRSVLYMGDDHFTPVHGKGSVVLEFSSGKSITLFNVLYVLKLCKNLISGPVLNKCGYKQVYESDKYILSKCGVFVGFGYYNNGMFMLNLNKVPDDSDSVYMSSSSTVVNSSLWHARLGHVHYKRMHEMSKYELIPAIDENPDKCTTCMLTKITRFCYVYLLYAKEEALDKFRIYKTEVELQQNELIKTLRTDRGGEFYGPVFFQSVGIIHETTAPYTPQQNGVAERKNRALKKMVKSMLSYSNESQRDDHFDDVPSEISEPRKGCKWIFKRKMKVDRTIDKFKARLVIQGFRQKEGIDYFDTYAPVARITTIRLLLALAAIHDVKTTFLNGDLDEEVYMKQPEGFVMPGNEHKVCKLVKSLYGLKQAPKFSMKDMGEADVILGIKIKREKKGIVITQSHYSEKILKKFNCKDCSPVSTPMDLVEKLKPNTGKPVDQLEYSRAIGCLMYAMTSTRLDIAYAVCRLSIFTSNPSRQHWQAITRVFKYLKDSSSTSRWVFLLGGGVISWASKKKTCITGSTMESEFVALAAAGARTKRTTYVNMKFCHFKKLGLGFLYSNGLTCSIVTTP